MEAAKAIHMKRVSQRDSKDDDINESVVITTLTITVNCERVNKTVKGKTESTVALAFRS